jgi:hypothetical protein
MINEFHKAFGEDQGENNGTTTKMELRESEGNNGKD